MLGSYIVLNPTPYDRLGFCVVFLVSVCGINFFNYFFYYSLFVRNHLNNECLPLSNYKIYNLGDKIFFVEGGIYHNDILH